LLSSVCSAKVWQKLPYFANSGELLLTTPAQLTSVSTLYAITLCQSKMLFATLDFQAFIFAGAKMHGKSGYLALYSYEVDRNVILILATRHQREVGYQ